jgi:hypothetical protein
MIPEHVFFGPATEGTITIPLTPPEREFLLKRIHVFLEHMKDRLSPTYEERQGLRSAAELLDRLKRKQ